MTKELYDQQEPDVSANKEPSGMRYSDCEEKGVIQDYGYSAYAPSVKLYDAHMILAS